MSNMAELFSAWQEVITLTNGGRPLSGPKVLADGDLLLEYVNGEVCIDDDSTSKPFSVSVVLHCSDTYEVYLKCSIPIVFRVYL